MRTDLDFVADRDTRVAQLVALVGAALNADLAELTQQIHRRLSTEIEELRGDERILQLLGSSIEGNVDTIVHMFQHGIGIDRVEPPTAAVEYARRLAQRASPSTPWSGHTGSGRTRCWGAVWTKYGGGAATRK